MKIYLHIGKHKTGTTAIQHFCMEHRDLLARHGIFWPDRKLERHPTQHSHLAQMVLDGGIQTVRSYVRQAIEDADADGAHSLLLSGEGFGKLEDEDIRAFLDLFAGHELEIIVYFRNIHHYAISVLQQQLKNKRGLPDVRLMIGAIRRNLNYTAFLHRWEAAARGAPVTVRCYDVEKKRLIASFLEILGIPDGDIPPPEHLQEANRSIDLATQFMLATSGSNYQLRNFRRVREDYQQVFDAQPFFPPLTAKIAEALCAGADIDLSHPCLEPHRDLLLAPLKGPEVPSDPLAYLDGLSRVLRRTVRRERWRRRLKWLQGLIRPGNQRR